MSTFLFFVLPLIVAAVMEAVLTRLAEQAPSEEASEREKKRKTNEAVVDSQQLHRRSQRKAERPGAALNVVEMHDEAPAFIVPEDFELAEFSNRTDDMSQHSSSSLAV